MSTSLSTTQMVARLQRKFSMGISNNDAMDFLNEAFRKIDQMSQGGFVWQLKTATITIPAGAQVANPLPADFDPGKTAILRGGVGSPTLTGIPFKKWQEFVNQQHFQNIAIGNFACWTVTPVFTLTAPTSYAYNLALAPDTAFPLAAPIGLPLIYHALNFQPFAVAGNVYFPTPDQFDSTILDLAEAELKRVYSMSGWEQLAAQATTAVQAMIDTYRSDRYDLAGLTDQAAQAQEKAAERAR
jgi:hypothetical protein